MSSAPRSTHPYQPHTPGDILSPSILDDAASQQTARPPRRTDPAMSTISRTPLYQANPLRFPHRCVPRNGNYLTGSIERQPATPQWPPPLRTAAIRPTNDDSTCNLQPSRTTLRAPSTAPNVHSSCSSDVHIPHLSLQDALDNGATRPTPMGPRQRTAPYTRRPPRLDSLTAVTGGLLSDYAPHHSRTKRGGISYSDITANEISAAKSTSIR